MRTKISSPRSANSGKSGGSLLDVYRGEISRCVKCGSCRAVCPPFLSTRGESFSARGRMALIKAFLDGRLEVSRIFEDRLATCTSCLACEATCTSGVPVCDIIQAAREQAVRETGAGLVKTLVGTVLRNDRVMQATAQFASLALHYGPDCRKSRFKTHRSNIRAPGQGTKGKVLFFPGCAVNYLQPDIGTSAIEVLNRIGFETIVPEGLTCCGRPLLSLGNRRAAEESAARNADLFSGLNPVAVVTACAACALTFKREYPKLLRPGTMMPALLDIHELLGRELSAVTLLPLKRTVTWHDPCHLGRGQGLAETARRILASAGAGLVEMKNADSCCGFGGVMRVTHPKLSNAIAQDKVKDIIATRASTVVTGCPACRMQIINGLRRAGSDIEVIHTVQLVREALSNEQFGMKNADECGLQLHKENRERKERA